MTKKELKKDLLKINTMLEEDYDTEDIINYVSRIIKKQDNEK